jgi:hypothetical protein
MEMERRVEKSPKELKKIKRIIIKNKKLHKNNKTRKMVGAPTVAREIMNCRDKVN